MLWAERHTFGKRRHDASLLRNVPLPFPLPSRLVSWAHGKLRRAQVNDPQFFELQAHRSTMVRRAILGQDLGHPYANRAGASRTYVADLPSLQLADPLG